MNLKEILAKVARGEELTDAEKAFLADYDPQAALDAAAASARRKAEERAIAAEAAKDEAEQKAREAREALDAKENEGKPELDRLKAENERLKGQIKERDDQISALSKDKETLSRDAKLSKIIAGSGIVFIPKVDGAAMTNLLKGTFGELSLEDLDDESQVAPILEAFRTANEGIIADTSGHGSGDDPSKRITFGGKSIENPWSKDHFNLTMQGKIQSADPALAERLRSQAA